MKKRRGRPPKVEQPAEQPLDGHCAYCGSYCANDGETCSTACAKKLKRDRDAAKHA